VVGIAGAVAVFISVFAMAQGFGEMAARTGRADRAIVLAKGATTEASSGLSRQDVATILDARPTGAVGAGVPNASADSLAAVRLTDRSTGLDAFATVRGVGAQVRLLRPEIRLVEGRMFAAGVNELIVGRTLQRRLEGLELGSRVALPQGDWTIVGVFETNGDSHESEILADAESLLSAYRRNVLNSVTVLLDSAEAFDGFRDAVVTHPNLSVQVKRERDYIAEASAPTRKLLGFVASFIGAIVASQFFNGSAVSTQSSASPAPVTFMLDVNPRLIALGIACACAIGLVGGLFPAIRVARSSVAVALRST
jgi:putative ABC transport system permease protein